MRDELPSIPAEPDGDFSRRHDEAMALIVIALVAAIGIIANAIWAAGASAGWW
jgi:hypothetical protein